MIDFTSLAGTVRLAALISKLQARNPGSTLTAVLGDLGSDPLRCQTELEEIGAKDEEIAVIPGVLWLLFTHAGAQARTKIESALKRA